MLRAAASLGLRYGVALVLIVVILAGFTVLACLAIPADAFRAVRRLLASKAT